jgi:hypothetical protein
MSQDTTKLLADLDQEISRVKFMLNKNNYHHGTALNVIGRRYRDELKQYKKIVLADRVEDGIRSYDLI